MPAPDLLFLLVLLGALVAAANLVVGVRLARAWRRRSTQVLTWPAPRPRQYGLTLSIGVVFGVLVAIEVFVLQRPPGYWFFESMMLAYYGYLVPLSLRIRTGFYEEGIWTGGAFLAYRDIAGLSWREDGAIVLVMVPRGSRLVRRLPVPQQHYAGARRLLRDRIKEHHIDLAPTGLDLGSHDERDDV